MDGISPVRFSNKLQLEKHLLSMEFAWKIKLSEHSHAPELIITQNHLELNQNVRISQCFKVLAKLKPPNSRRVTREVGAYETSSWAGRLTSCRWQGSRARTSGGGYPVSGMGSRSRANASFGRWRLCGNYSPQLDSISLGDPKFGGKDMGLFLGRPPLLLGLQHCCCSPSKYAPSHLMGLLRRVRMWPWYPSTRVWLLLLKHT